MGLSDYLDSIDNAFPLFSFGEAYVHKTLDRFKFNEEGIQRRWHWHDRLAENVLEFVNERFPELEPRACLAVRDLQMGWIREEIVATEREFRLYLSLVEKYSRS